MTNELKRGPYRFVLDLQTFSEDPDPQPEPPKPEFTPEQQAEMNRIIADRLARQQRKHDDEKAAAQAEAERKKLEEDAEYKTLYETAQAELAAAKESAKAAELSATKTRLLIAAGYGADQLDRVGKYVSGDDEDALKASIDEVKADIPPKASGADPNPGNPHRQTPPPNDPAAAAKATYERLIAEGKIR